MLKRLFYSVILLVLVLPGLFVLINQIDVAVDSEVLSIAQKDYPPAKIEDNAYFAYIGLLAAADSNSHTIGQQVIQAYHASAEKEIFRAGSVANAVVLPLNETRLTYCEDYVPANNYCVDDIRQQRQEYARLIELNRLLLTRYQAILDYPDFIETSFYFDPYSSYVPLSLHKKYIAMSGVAWVDGHTAEALDLLYKDIKFNRQLLKKATTLVYKTIAIEALERSYNLLTGYIRECPNCVVQHAMSTTLLTPLDEQELSVTRILERELKYNYESNLEPTNTEQSRYTQYRKIYCNDPKKPCPQMIGWLGYMTLDNATLNLLAKDYLAAIKLSRYNFADYYRQKDKVFPPHTNIDFAWYDYLYNPGGKALMMIWQLPEEYHLKNQIDIAYQLDARIRLNRLLLQLKSLSVTADSVQPFLSQHSNTHLDPYTDKPIHFDLIKHTLFINVPGHTPVSVSTD